MLIKIKYHEFSNNNYYFCIINYLAKVQNFCDNVYALDLINAKNNYNFKKFYAHIR